jgi:microcystin degradation protein MlrC
MRLLIAMLKHETNTFSPVVTDLQRFKNWGLHEDESVVTAYKGTAHPIAAFLDIAEREGADIVTPVAAEAMPSGLVSREAYDYLTGRILNALREHGPFDAALLDLHGAMVPEHLDDGEGPLLAAMRAIAPDLPIAVTFDMHGNMTPEVMENATIVNCYKSYPHTDMYETGLVAGEAMMRTLRGEISPILSWGYAPILAQTLKMGTADQPMKGLQALTREIEREEGVICASVFGGFPMADIPLAGVSAVVVSDKVALDDARNRLLSHAWHHREGFIYSHEPLKSAVMRAKGFNVSPVILLDHADNVGSGGTSDDMTVIEEVLRQGLEGVAVATVFDPASVFAMQKAGVGATLTLDLGGKSDMPSINAKAKPLRVAGKVLSLNSGTWVVEGPMYTGTKIHTGTTAVFEVAGVKIVVTTLHHEPWDAGIFTNNGINPRDCRFLLLKSRVHYRAGFEAIGKATVTLDGRGVTTSDNSHLTYNRLQRPIYPFDTLDFTP